MSLPCNDCKIKLACSATPVFYHNMHDMLYNMHGYAILSAWYYLHEHSQSLFRSNKLRYPSMGMTIICCSKCQQATCKISCGRLKRNMHMCTCTVHHRPMNLGCLFSLNALIPSRRSSVVRICTVTSTKVNVNGWNTPQDPTNISKHRKSIVLTMHIFQSTNNMTGESPWAKATWD